MSERVRSIMYLDPFQTSMLYLYNDLSKNSPHLDVSDDVVPYPDQTNEIHAMVGSETCSSAY